MQIKTTLSESEIKKIAHYLGMQIQDFQNHGYMPRRKQNRFTGQIRNVTPDAKASYGSQTVGWSKSRNMPMIPCWHGYYDFMATVFAHDPNAEISTGRIGKIVYRGIGEFHEKAEDSKYANIGSPMFPAQYIDKCNH